MKNNNQLHNRISNRLIQDEYDQQNLFRLSLWDKPLVVQQADEIVQLQNALADAKYPDQLKRKLLELKRRLNDPDWHTHLCGK
ncbi:MAG: hypothetical protein HXX20_06120 [Chloroflexi bacterium]|nr:hypothetical protein [Chloroflexota bacterium]